MTHRELEELARAIETVKKHGFEVELSKELLEANQLLTRLRRLERIRHEILQLKQSTVAEIRSYQSPPQVVHTVMTSTFLLLGHKEKETKVLLNLLIRFFLIMCDKNFGNNYEASVCILAIYVHRLNFPSNFHQNDQITD